MDLEDEDGTLEDAKDVEEKSQDRLEEEAYSTHTCCGRMRATLKMDYDCYYPFRSEGGVKLSEISIANLLNLFHNTYDLYLYCHSWNYSLPCGMTNTNRRSL